MEKKLKVYIANDWTIEKNNLNIDLFSIHYDAGFGSFMFWVTVLGFSLVVEKE